MKLDLLDKLRCPKCKGELKSEPFDHSDGEDIREGILLCGACNLLFPIMHHVPVMLMFRTNFHDKFESSFGDKLAMWPKFRIPSETPMTGEINVQETFTEEWNPIDAEEDDLNFSYTFEDQVRLNREVWLKWMKSTSDKISNILVVGCGSGREAAALGTLFPDASVYAIDLNFALLQSGEKLSRNQQLRLTICSLFHLPFAEGSFDLVYSNGVLHHTFSTRKAFGAIAQYTKEGGRMFVWLYGLDDHLLWKGFAGIITRCNYYVEMILRPIVSRLPGNVRSVFFYIIGIILHPLILTRVRHRNIWRLKNTIHSLRDWLSPRYAYVQSYNEVSEWFEREGYRVIDIQSPAAYWDLFKKRHWGVGMTGQKLASMTNGHHLSEREEK